MSAQEGPAIRPTATNTAAPLCMLSMCLTASSSSPVAAKRHAR